MKLVARWFVFLVWWTVMIVGCASVVWVPAVAFITNEPKRFVVAGVYGFLVLFFAAMWTAE